MKKDQERFRTYYERKRMRKHSLFGAAKEGFEFAAVMILGLILPVGSAFIYSDRLGFWWWAILLIYSTLMAIILFAVLEHRDIMGIRGYFTDEEFAKTFKKDLWWIRIMDRLKGLHNR